jgi:uncharacterized protein
LDEPLTDAEYERLVAILRSFPGKDAMNLEEMDGFFAALICAPVMVPLSEYLPEIWGGDETAPFAEADCLDEFFNLAMRHWNFVSRELGSADLVFIPRLYLEEDEEFPKGNRWAQGFLKGIAMCREGWNEIFEDEDKSAMLLPAVVLAHENDPEPEMRPWKTPPSLELRKQVCTALAVSAQHLYDYFRPHRIQETQRGAAAARQSGTKVGRNEPCPCGSGKKYKRCCGK